MLLSRLKAKFNPLLLSLLMAAPAMTGCSDFMHDGDLPECQRDIRVKLSFTCNMLNEERVADVETAEVYALDKDGNIVAEVKTDKATLAANDYYVSLPIKDPGDYRLIVWGGLTEDSPFSLGTSRASTVDELNCFLNYEIGEDGRNHNRQHLPGLYHSISNETFIDTYAMQETTVNLTKNTNLLTVVLHNEADRELDPEEYTFVVADDNAVMGHDNSIQAEGQNVVYHPLSVESARTPLPDGNGGELEQDSESVVAQIPLARLMADSEGQLHIYRGTEELVRIGITELLLLSKQYEAPDLEDQDYLDRQDTYKVHFFINLDGLWNSNLIYINDWECINQEIDF